jgi:hypothetical protein
MCSSSSYLFYAENYAQFYGAHKTGQCLITDLKYMIFFGKTRPTHKIHNGISHQWQEIKFLMHDFGTTGGKMTHG